MAEEPESCLFCEAEVGVTKLSTGNFSQVACTGCQTYIIGHELSRQLHQSDWDESERMQVAAILCEEGLRYGNTVVIGLDEEELSRSPPLSGETTSKYTYEEALNRFPSSVPERLERGLLNLVAATEYPGQKVDIFEYGIQLIYAENSDVARFLTSSLKSQQLVAVSLTSTTHSCKIRAPGWAEVERLMARSGDPTQAFLMLPLSPRNGERGISSEEITALSRAMKAGLNEAGYDPLIITDEQFNTDIHDRILAEIRRSRFVVADYTDLRPNVYYEAGFAEGLGKPVIYTCREDWIEHQEFDVRQRNHIVWESAGDLENQLQDRVEATLGRPK